MYSSDVAIVGGGVIGLALAWKLAKEGATVTVIERGQVGEGASWAAAGMLAPFAEAAEEGPFARLTQAGLKAYPAFVSALEEETGLTVELCTVGLLRIALDEAEEAALGESFSRQCNEGLPVHWLTGDEARKLEPGLSPAIQAAIRSAEEWHVEPRRLTRALAVACACLGVNILQETAITHFETAGSRIRAVVHATGEVACGQVVVAGGAWSKSLGDALNVALPVFPVRGQIASLGPCLPVPVRHTVYAKCGYLVPKADGRVLVGATQEDSGFDTRPTCEGIGGLLAMAPRLVPELAAVPIESAWAGLRPGTPDGLPILGRLPGWENAFAATGHFRNGILLAAVTAEIMADLVLHGKQPPLLDSFLPDRFDRSQTYQVALGAH